MHHLAQLNTARLRAPLDDPRTEGFTSQIDAIHALAEAAPGFVWRLKDEQQDYSTSPALDPLAVVFRRRAEWFEPRPGQASVVLWWVKAGEIPTLPQAMARPRFLETNGPSPKAFTFSRPFPAPGV